MKSPAVRTAKFVSGSRIARLLLAAAATSALLAVGCGGDVTDGNPGWQSRAPGTSKNAGSKDEGSKSATDTGGKTNTNNGETPAGTDPTHPAQPGDPTRPVDPTAPAKTGTFDINIGTPDVTGDLLEEKTSVVNVAPIDGFTGAVTLSLEGAGTDVTAAFEGGPTATVNVTGASASANLKIKSSKSGASVIKVIATAGTVKVSKDLTFTATKTLTITIPADAQMNRTASSFGPGTGPITVTTGGGLNLQIKNLDSAGHIIHGGGQGGFAHGNTNSSIQTGELDEARTISTGTFNFYLHDLGQQNSPAGKLIVK